MSTERKSPGTSLSSLKAYTAQDLKQLLHTGEWFRNGPEPISRHRALSHINNPQAEPMDVLLLVAFDGETVIGHLGILPDRCFWQDREYRVGWLTAWWANPNYVGTGLMLLMRAMSLYGGRVGASGFSEDAQRVYQATKKFRTIRELEGATIFARLNAGELLPRKVPWLARVRPVLRALDFAANQLFRLRQAIWKHRQKIPDGFRVEYVPELDQEAETFMERFRVRGFARRGPRELAWIARYPWVACAPLAPDHNFHFACYAKSYSSFNIKVFDRDNRLVAVLMLTVIDDQLIVPYCYHDGQSDLVAMLLGHHLIALRLNRVTTFRGDVIESLAALGFPCVLKKRKKRAWIMSGLGAGPDQPGEASDVQDGDGDCAFTI